MYVSLWRALALLSLSRCASALARTRVLLTDTVMTDPGLPLCRNSSRAETTVEELRARRGGEKGVKRGKW